MSDVDRNRQREHWQAIAEQLGLGRDPEERSASEAPAEAAPPSRDDEPSTEPHAELAEPAVTVEPPVRGGRRGRSATTDRKEPRHRQGSEQPRTERPLVETPREPAEPVAERADPKRGRRRRPGRAAAAAETESSNSGPTGVPSAGEAAAEERADRPKRRGRGRGRQKKADDTKARETSPAGETANKVSAAAESAEIDLEDVGSLSNWSAPSWTELIASLYRPER